MDFLDAVKKRSSLAAPITRGHNPSIYGLSLHFKLRMAFGKIHTIKVS